MSKWTPGPWTYRKANSGERWWVEGPDATQETRRQWYVAEVTGRRESNEANARLIAAAPEMYGALRTARELLLDVPHSNKECEALGLVLRAIEKAEGES